MMKPALIYRKMLTMILLLYCFSMAGYSGTQEKIIRIAILDNFHFQPNITNEYDQYYLSGIEVARSVADEKGFKLEYKVFRYSRDPLAIFNTIPQVNAWNPDVIIGPRNSNMFITIKNSFKNILVLSPFATSSEIESMPKNYYSLTLGDPYTAQAIAIFLERHYHQKGVFSIVEADCKNCVDISHELSAIYQKNYPPKRFTEKFFLQGTVKGVDIEKILQGYPPGDVIFLPDTSYASVVLMVRITNYLGRPMFFVGADDWGSSRNSEVGKLEAHFPYYGIRVTPWSFDAKSSGINEFNQRYRKIYHAKPIDPVSLLAYTTIISIISAINQFSDSKVKLMRETILTCYMRALNSNKNWYRPNEFQFYKIDKHGDVLIDRVKIPL